MKTKDFHEDLRNLIEKVKNKENFAFSRFSDGELYMLQGKQLVLAPSYAITGDKIMPAQFNEEDLKDFDPERDKAFGQQLYESFTFKADNFYKGICCPCCIEGEDGVRWMRERLTDDPQYLTWANLFVNANYPIFMEEMVPEIKKRQVVLIANEKFNMTSWEASFPNTLGAFKIGKMFDHLENLPRELHEYIGTKEIKDVVFLFSASALSEIVIAYLWKYWPQNTYIDVGTTLAPIMGFGCPRDYLRGYWLNESNQYHGKKCVW